MAKMFNEAFTQKVKKLVSSLSGPIFLDPVLRLQNWLDKRNDEIPVFDLQKITKIQLQKYISKLKGSKSCGIDQIDSYSLKLAAPHIEDVLLHVVNTAMEKGYPTCWKIQLIFPFFKKKDRTDPENYRPVSHIVEISKIVEYAVQEQTLDHFLSNDIFHANHHGFLPQHSTASALTQLYEKWLERKKTICCNLAFGSFRGI